MTYIASYALGYSAIGRLGKVLREDFFLRHIPGVYNATWTDMFIETTYVWLGHGPAGAVGLSTDYDQMKKLALSFVLCGALLSVGKYLRIFVQ